MSYSDESESRQPLRLRRRSRGATLETSSRASWPAPCAPVTDVKEIVRTNAVTDHRAGLYGVKPMRRRWRRRGLDFIVMCALGNGLGIGFLQWVQPSAFASILTLSGMLFYTLALGWVMLVHIDDY